MADRGFRRNENADMLFDVILGLKTRQECYDFFEDLCTMKELADMTMRIRAADMLLRGDTYEQIVRKTEISTATISRINRCIRYGNGGYRLGLERLAQKKKPE